MKKTLVSALTTALVVGAASTTFAAANPFSDVPADHWAYDAVAQLAQDGVINGYGDGTFRGQQEITRYEMAQMVAKAMAKTDVSAADKAMIDKLAAEFSDELNNLGVRVSNLEKKTDNVKFTGEVRYRYTKDKHDFNNSENNSNGYLFRFEPQAQVNENWTAKARIDYESNSKESTNADTTVDRIYMDGNYGTTNIKLGKLPYTTINDKGMVFDDKVSGGQVTFGKDVKATVTAGRFNANQNDHPGNYAFGATDSGAANYQAIEVNYAKNAWNVGLGYHHFGADMNDNTSIANKRVSTAKYNTDSVNIWSLGAGYKFDKNFAINAAYAKNTQGDFDGALNKAYSFELDYKGATPANKGSFGIFAAYRYLGDMASIAPTYDAIARGQKGWELGTQYVFMPNVMGTLKYFKGNDILDGTTQGAANLDDGASKIFGQVEFFF